MNVAPSRGAFLFCANFVLDFGDVLAVLGGPGEAPGRCRDPMARSHRHLVLLPLGVGSPGGRKHIEEAAEGPLSLKGVGLFLC
jgi:hypothetical protein